ncbi:transglycosylase SLT domain-containing protein [Streptomyces sp. NPDC005955]|uniref:transglycosylase SLT domain-containing protein n=1 Tax=Streptomyces sp. NPDC005955 TaxID=3364738 RepID=UPI0036C90F8D
MAEGMRGPIKVGSGYVEIIPKILHKDIQDLRTKVSSELAKIGATAAKEVNRAVKEGLAGLPKETEKQAKKARAAVEREAVDSAKTLRKIERQITREFGEEAAARFHEYRKVEERKRRLLAATSANTRTALRETVRQEERAATDRQAAAARLERDRSRLLAQARREHDRIEQEKRREVERQARLALRAQQTALRAQVEAQRAATREIVASIREQAAAQRAALQDGISDQQRRMTVLRDQVRDANRDINATNRTTQSYFARTGQSLRRVGTWFDQVGMSINEAGNILTTRFLAPLAGAGAALSAVGIENADKRLLGQLGLSSAGVSKRVSAAQMHAIQNYAIDTPFSIDVMHEYQMKLIRSVAGADKAWFSTNATKRTGAANKAAERTTDIIMAIGDSMARAGNLNPEQFKRAMYAMDMIMDMDRAPTKNVKQLAAASGMPAAELAQLLGFKNSTQMWKIIGTPAKDGGGVTGVQIMDAMLNYWNPEKYEGDQKSGGSKGFAATMTSETITGRIQQMKERAAFELGNLFVEEGKGGQYQYTALGNQIAGKGGILDQVQGLAEKWGPRTDEFLGLFLDGVETFISMVDTAATWIEESGLGELAAPVAEFLIEWGPLILAVGLLSKVVGKAVGLVGRAFTPLAAVTRAGTRAVDGQRDIRSQRRAARDARDQVQAAGGSRQAGRQAGRDAYRQQRTVNRNGDDRSNPRRLLDGVLGRDSRTADGQRQLRELEDQIREARDEATRLRGELREVDRENLRQIRDALGGNGSASVTGAARQASQAVNAVQQQTQRANTANLTQLHQELEAVRKSSQGVVSELSAARDRVNRLDAGRLSTVRVEVDQLKSAAHSAGREIGTASSRVGALEKRNLTGVTGSVGGLRDAAKRAADQIGDGAMSSSTSGRTANLNRRRLTDIIREFRKLTNAADDSYAKVGQGTGSGSLAGRIGLLNQRSLKGVTGHVSDLEAELKAAKGEADGLDNALGDISRKSPGSAGGGYPKRTRKARGGVIRESDLSSAGVIPGYAPWVDKVPALLSPGESVLRPEVTQAIGPETIDTWNSLAVRGRVSRHARGMSGDSGGSLSEIHQLMDLQNIWPVGTAMLKTMKLDGASDPLGGGVQSGILRTGDHSAGLGGAVAAQKFQGMYDWMTGDVYTLLKRVPSGIGQIAGILGGSLSPVLADHFWDDVWRGSGNIVERGQRYLGNVFSMDTLSEVWGNLWGGATDSAGALWDTVTNPVDALTSGFDDVGKIVSGSYNNLVGMVSTVKEVRDAPLAYAGRVYGDFMANAQAAMPNTKGLFDFSNGATVAAKTPDFGADMVSAGSGSGAQRWAPVATQALSLLNLPASALGTVLYRIGLESGGNPTIVNKWDSNWEAGHPSVGLMQVIGPTYRAHAGPFGKTGPFLYGTSVNPLANIYAGLNYAQSRYGSSWQSMLAGRTGYASGTLSASPGLALVGERGRELVAFGGGERVFDNTETEGILNGRTYEIHVHEARNEPTPQAVLRALRTAETLYATL